MAVDAPVAAGAPVAPTAKGPGLSKKARIGPDAHKVVANPFVLGLRNPWGMAFLPTGELLVTERAGEVRVIRDGKLHARPLAGVPAVYEQGQGGLLDIAIHPQFSANRFVYLTYSRPAGGGKGGNTVLWRATLDGMSLKNPKVLYAATPNTTASYHFGSRIVFDGKGHIFFSIGDRGNRDENPQSVRRDGGKIYRVNEDGSIPDDNPFANKPGSKTAIFSYGHRNPQGLARHPETGTIWSHEHGPKGGDELNIIRPGRNYGWPIISYGINYNGTPFAKSTAAPGMAQSVTHWVPSIAPCGMTFIKGARYPGWDGDLIVGSLKFGYLVHLDVDGETIVSQEKVAEGIGRVRSVVQGPDGLLYVGVEGRGVFRLIPRT